MKTMACSSIGFDRHWSDGASAAARMNIVSKSDINIPVLLRCGSIFEDPLG
jgi:hypothetical protein